ncbi:helix-turn-helix transcriptional regulator [Caldovatus sediminis]|uniref:Helix-turn-helix transcriptional regulator n=1 Tax=Caldovatus sediminis TaxID=2041189 RepID=A0A8J2ZC92_9PROT|nr:helix-turn-helix transcriptional regulator [Caldovatus sediminis]
MNLAVAAMRHRAMRPGDAERGPGPVRTADRCDGAVRPVAVALRIADPALRARLAGIVDAAPGLAPAPEGAAAAALVTDRVLPREGGGAAGPPMLVLAKDAAARARALHAGVGGVLPPDAGEAQLVAAIVAVAHGLVVRPASPRPVPPRPEPAAAGAAEPVPALTPREREVLALLAAGAANKVIARRLGLSFHTAKAHVASVLAKLGASSRADAVARGIRAGLVLL